MNIGIIGAGRWAEVHKDALQKVGANVTSVLVASEASQERVEQEWGIAATLDKELFLKQDTQAVIIVSPNYLHAEHSILCLNAGKHVLVEKPFATTLADADRMIEAAKQNNKVLANGLQMRVYTLFETVKKLMQAGHIGKPIHLHLDLWRRPYREGSSAWKQDPSKLGSSILEEPIHYLDLARWLLLETKGEPMSVEAWSKSREGKDYLHENLDIRLEYMDGSSALISRSIAGFEHQISLHVVGETGSLKASWQGDFDMDLNPRVELLFHNGANRDDLAKRLKVEQKTGHAYDLHRQTAAFLQAIQEGTEPTANAKDGRAAVALCLTIEEALKRL